MRIAYVDTSCIAALLLSETGVAAVRKRLDAYGKLISSNLLEAELRSACRREDKELPFALIESIAWIWPKRPLRTEIARVLAAGYLRGADCWHLASALHARSEFAQLEFVTLDVKQALVARDLGFIA